MDAPALNNRFRRTTDTAWSGGNVTEMSSARPAITLPEAGRAPLGAEARAASSPVSLCDDLMQVAAALDVQLGRCRRQARPATVLWVDVMVGAADGTHPMLQAMGQHLRHHLRPTDSVTQVGCQGFVVLLIDAGEQASMRVRRRLEDLLKSPCNGAEGAVAPLPTRVGRAVHGLDGEEADALLLVAVMWAGL